MRAPGRPQAVLRPARLGPAGMAVRRSLDRRNLLAGIFAALLVHLSIVGAFYLIDRWRIRDIGEWSGPVLVKIGVPEAPESPAPDPGPVPEAAETPPAAPVTPPDTPSAESGGSTAPPPPDASAAQTPRPVPERPSDTAGAVETPAQPSAPPPRPAPAPQPSRELGSEEGNSYLMTFEGTDDEVGRSGAVGFITSYMPLPQVLEGSMVSGARSYFKMSPEIVITEIERYWEPIGNQYFLKREPFGDVPMKDRPYYWSLLVNSLGYNIADADWRSAGMRPVVAEFTVGLSKEDEEGSQLGAALSDIRLVSRTNDPKVDEAVIYGLSKWVYYNKTEKPVKGRITYRFDQ